MRKPFIDKLTEMALVDERIVVLTGDLGFMALEGIRDAIGNRFINVGAAEQDMIGVATGMAESGMRPFCYSIATFATMRGFEFIRNGPILQNLPVSIIGMGAGFDYGFGGPTHHALEDISLLRPYENMTIVSPGDDDEAVKLLPYIYKEKPGPTYYRLSKTSTTWKPPNLPNFRSRVSFISTGIIGQEVEKARAKLMIDYNVISDHHSESILNSKIGRLRTTCVPELYVTVEEHLKCGGLGSIVAEQITEDTTRPLVRLLRLGALKISHNGVCGDREYMLKLNQLDVDSIVVEVAKALVLIGKSV